MRANEQGPHLKHKVARHNQALNHSLAMSNRDMASRAASIALRESSARVPAEVEMKAIASIVELSSVSVSAPRRVDRNSKVEPARPKRTARVDAVQARRQEPARLEAWPLSLS